MQARRGVENPTTPNETPGRSTIVDVMRAQNPRVSVRDVLLAGGLSRLTVKEMFR